MNVSCFVHRKITREQQDTLAARSHARAAAAQRDGRFDSQIVPVRTQWRDPKTGEVSRIVVDKDDGIREGTTTTTLAKLPAVFKKGEFIFFFIFSCGQSV
tara:strand:- start:441 stop:740 length:300 start_codon:yes stop_codon:yes gene_type:complete